MTSPLTSKPRRLLIVMPSWLGDTVMATPALRLLRDHLPGTFIGALARRGIDDVLEGGSLIDEIHVDRAEGMMGPKRVAARLRHRRYDAALLLTNSFSTALITRIAGISRRIGYARDGRSLLLTDRLPAPKLPSGDWAPVPAVAYYLRAARAMLGELQDDVQTWCEKLAPAEARQAVLEIAISPAQQHRGDEVLARAGVTPHAPLALLNPGGNNPAKRWPASRFADVAKALTSHHGLCCLVNGSPREADIVREVVSTSDGCAVSLVDAGVTIGALKSIIARCRIVVTNDTGPRHLAAALGIPVVAIFGPTDPHWTIIRAPAGEAILTPPKDSVGSDEHDAAAPIQRITTEMVISACHRLLAQIQPHIPPMMRINNR